MGVEKGKGSGGRMGKGKRKKGTREADDDGM